MEKNDGKNLENITKSFGTGNKEIKAFHKINLSVEEGEMVAVMGRSGYGKSTLLNILGGLIQIDSGSYLFENEHIECFNQKQLSVFRTKNIGYILQYYALLDDRTIFQNVALPLQYGKNKKNVIKEKVEKLLKRMEIYDKKDNYPSELSGGQCQRTAIARALANNPDVILADEPTGSLDSNTETMIMNMFKQLNRDGKTIIIVTHDNSVADYCSRIITIKDGKNLGEVL